MQYNAQFKVFEPLQYKFNVCEAVLLWEQVCIVYILPVLLSYLVSQLFVLMVWRMQYRNMTTVLTREYLDVRPKGWEEYAPQRIAQLYGLSTHYAVCFCH